jgi:chemotaxis receptor (MCP) glutamine deamidase CheD
VPYQADCAGMIDDFSYTSTDPKTPAYFCMTSCDQHSDEQLDPFSRTGRHNHISPTELDSAALPARAVARHSAQCVAIFSSYGDTFPDSGGFGSLSTPFDDRSDNVFGSAGNGVGGSADLEASSSLEARLFQSVPPSARVPESCDGDALPGMDVLGGVGARTVTDFMAHVLGSTGVGTVELEGRVLGASARVSPLDLEANRSALEQHLFGSLEDEPHIALRGGHRGPLEPALALRDGDDMDASKDTLEANLFGASQQPIVDGLDKDASRTTLVAKLFGAATTPPTDERDMDASRNTLEAKLFGAVAAQPADDMDMEANRSSLEGKLFGAAAEQLAIELDMDANRNTLEGKFFGAAATPPVNEADLDVNRNTLEARLFGSAATPAAGNLDLDVNRNTLEAMFFGAASMPPADGLDMDANRNTLEAKLFGAASMPPTDGSDMVTSSNMLGAQLFGATETTPTDELDVDASRNTLEAKLFGAAAAQPVDDMDMEANKSSLEGKLFGAAAEQLAFELDMDANRNTLEGKFFGAAATPPVDEADLDVNRNALEARLFGSAATPAAGDLDLDVNRNTLEAMFFGAASMPPADGLDMDANRSTLEAKLFGAASMPPTDGSDMVTSSNMLEARLVGATKTPPTDELDVDANRNTLEAKLFGAALEPPADDLDMVVNRRTLEANLGATHDQVDMVPAPGVDVNDPGERAATASASCAIDSGFGSSAIGSQQTEPYTLLAHNNALRNDAARNGPDMVAHPVTVSSQLFDSTVGPSREIADTLPDAEDSDKDVDDEIASIEVAAYALMVETRKIGSSVAGHHRAGAAGGAGAEWTRETGGKLEGGLRVNDVVDGKVMRQGSVPSRQQTIASVANLPSL